MSTTRHRPAAKLDAMAAAMRASDVPFDELDAGGVRTRFPEIAMGTDEHALFHAEAGTVLADAALRALRPTCNAKVPGSRCPSADRVERRSVTRTGSPRGAGHARSLGVVDRGT